MRKPIALCAALSIAAFSFVASEAAEVQIGDFVFGCKTSDGKVRKPQFGDMNGVFYTEIRGQEKACRDAVKRMIANCHQHTRFLDPGDNEKYPECLPVFQEQAGECAAFFREEIAKCSGDGGGAAESAATINGVLILSRPEDIDLRYEGGVRNGKPHGHGVAIGESKFMVVRTEGEWRDGVLHGPFVEIVESIGLGGNKYTTRTEGEYRDGKPHGPTLFRDSEGYSECTRYENGNRVELLHDDICAQRFN